MIFSAKQPTLDKGASGFLYKSSQCEGAWDESDQTYLNLPAIHGFVANICKIYFCDFTKVQYVQYIKFKPCAGYLKYRRHPRGNLGGLNMMIFPTSREQQTAVLPHY